MPDEKPQEPTALTADEKPVLFSYTTEEDNTFRIQYENGAMVIQYEDVILRSEFNGDWDQYRAVMNDGQVRSMFGNRRMGLTNLDYEFIVEEGMPENMEAEVRGYLRTFMARWRNSRAAVRGILDAILLGYKAAEAVWKVEDGMILLDRLLPRPNRLCRFNSDSRFIFRPNVIHAFQEIPEPLKIYALTYEETDGDRHGRGLGELLYHFVWARNHGWRHWSIFSARHAMPVPIAQLTGAAKTEDKNRIREKMKAIANGTAMVVPEGIDIKYLEPQRYGSINVFESFINAVNGEIAKICSGQSLTQSASSEGTGAYASYEVADSISGRITEDDAKYVDDYLTRLVRDALAMNFGKEVASAVCYRTICREEKLTANEKADVLTKVSAMTKEPLAVPMSWYRKEFKIPAPAEGEEVILLGRPAPALGPTFAEGDQKKKTRARPFLT